MRLLATIILFYSSLASATYPYCAGYLADLHSPAKWLQAYEGVLGVIQTEIGTEKTLLWIEHSLKKKKLFELSAETPTLVHARDALKTLETIGATDNEAIITLLKDAKERIKNERDTAKRIVRDTRQIPGVKLLPKTEIDLGLKHWYSQNVGRQGNETVIFAQFDGLLLGMLEDGSVTWHAKVDTIKKIIHGNAWLNGDNVSLLEHKQSEGLYFINRYKLKNGGIASEQIISLPKGLQLLDRAKDHSSFTALDKSGTSVQFVSILVSQDGTVNVASRINTGKHARMSQTGAYLAEEGGPGNLNLLNPADLSVVKTLPFETKGRADWAFSSDDKTITIVTDSKTLAGGAHIRILDVATEKIALDLDIPWDSSAFQSPKFIANDSKLLFLAKYGIRLVDVATGKIEDIELLCKNTPFFLAEAKTKPFIAIRETENDIVFVDASSAEVIGKAKFPNSVREAWFSQDGKKAYIKITDQPKLYVIEVMK